MIYLNYIGFPVGQYWGNWGGQGWCGGKHTEDTEEPNWSVEAADWVDQIFKDHDRDYWDRDEAYENSNKSSADKRKYWEDTIKADQKLIDRIESRDGKPVNSMYGLEDRAGDVAAEFFRWMQINNNYQRRQNGYDLPHDPPGFPWPGVDPTTNANYRNALTPPRPRDPLAIDLDGDGIETVGVGTSPILFDHNADGIRTGTGWVRSDDAWLVLDRDGNGLIDTGRELFGVDTLLSGTPGIDAVYASTGFEALAALNSNGDAVFNASDAAFGSVRLWQDLNQDGVSQAGELSTLAQKGITGIGLAASTSMVNLGNGNTLTGTAVVTRTTGGSTQVGSVSVGVDTTAGNLNLANNPFYREFTDSIPFTAAALALPEMRGSGAVRDLREALSLGTAASAALVSAVQAFAQGSSRDAQQASLDEVLRTWAATEAVADFNIEAVGQETRIFKVAGSSDAALQAKLTQIIPVLEVFNAAKVEDAGGTWAPTTSVIDGKTTRTYNITAQQATLMPARSAAPRNSA